MTPEAKKKYDVDYYQRNRTKRLWQMKMWQFNNPEKRQQSKAKHQMKLSELTAKAAERIASHENKRICSAVDYVVAQEECHYTVAFIILDRIRIFYPFVEQTSWPFPSQEESDEKILACLLASASFMSLDAINQIELPQDK